MFCSSEIVFYVVFLPQAVSIRNICNTRGWLTYNKKRDDSLALIYSEIWNYFWVSS